MHNRKIAVSDYEWLATTFNPTKFDAVAWVALAKRAGVRYITITSRHHDGFAMFQTAHTPYNIVDGTPFRRDPLKELADVCHGAGIKLFFYCSQLDWHHPDYWPRGRMAWDNGRPDHGDWSRCLAFMNAQLTELLTRYGDVGGIWFDGMWDKPDAPWQLDSTYGLIHRLQPAALVVPNHHQHPRSGEDVQTFEQDFPGANSAGFNTSYVSGDLPLETSLTMNGSWGFNITDKDFKSVRTLVGYLVRAAGNGANLLLNIGPRPDGTISPEFTARLDSPGAWLAGDGPARYGRRPVRRPAARGARAASRADLADDLEPRVAPAHRGVRHHGRPRAQEGHGGRVDQRARVRRQGSRRGAGVGLGRDRRDGDLPLLDGYGGGDRARHQPLARRAGG